jgi:hypothetical protein
MAMVELEPVALGAPPPLCIDEAAAAPVPLTDGTPDRRRYMARGAGEVALLDRLPGRPGRTETPSLESLQFLGHRLLDDGGQITIRYLRPHQGSKPLELVMELGAGRELDLVAGGGEHLHACRSGGQHWRVVRHWAGRDSVQTECRCFHHPSDGSRLRQLPHHGWRVRPRRQLRKELFDLTLGATRGSLQQRIPVLRGQVRCQLGDGG